MGYVEKLKEQLGKFSLAEACSNSDGKTSGSGTAGLYVVFIGGIGFLSGIADRVWGTKSNDVMMYSSGLITIGATLLGVRKANQKNSVMDEATTESKIIEPNPQ